MTIYPNKFASSLPFSLSIYLHICELIIEKIVAKIAVLLENPNDFLFLVDQSALALDYEIDSVAHFAQVYQALVLLVAGKDFLKKFRVFIWEILLGIFSLIK